MKKEFKQSTIMVDNNLDTILEYAKKNMLVIYQIELQGGAWVTELISLPDCHKYCEKGD